MLVIKIERDAKLAQYYRNAAQFLARAALEECELFDQGFTNATGTKDGFRRAEIAGNKRAEVLFDEHIPVVPMRGKDDVGRITSSPPRWQFSALGFNEDQCISIDGVDCPGEAIG